MKKITDRTEIRAILSYNKELRVPTWAVQTSTGTSCQLLEVEPGMMNDCGVTVKIANGDIEFLRLSEIHLRGE